MDISEDKIQILNDLDKNTVTIINGEAGTGKTLIGSLGGQKLLEDSKDWEKALYLTYSKLAKRQINYTIKKLRVENHLKADFIRKMEIMNYHSFWWHLINHHFCFLGIPRKPILSTKSELKSFREEIFCKVPKEIIPKSFLTKKNTINKNKETKIKEILSGLGALYHHFGATYFGKNAEDYIESRQFLKWSNDQILERNHTGYFSHDETVCWAHKLLKIHPNIRSIIREKYPVFIFDEFQDTDIAQWEIIKILKPKTIIVLADPAQTIHQWRGADPGRVNQFREFCQNCPEYIRVETRLLKTKHRSSKNMSAPENINFITVGDDFDSKDPIEFNKLKWNAKMKCKDIVIDIKKNKNISVLCLTNKIADEVTSFFRTNKYKYPISCSRYGADYSPFDKTRNLILEILDSIEKRGSSEIQYYLSNRVFQELFPIKLVKCSRRSRNAEPRKRWRLAGKLKTKLSENFGDGLLKLAIYISHIGKIVRCRCDLTVLRILKKLGESIQRLNTKQWKSLSPTEKRIKVDSVIMQYENAVAEYQNDEVSIMTVHQVKSQEFDNVIIFWFSTLAWNKSDGSRWNTCDQSHANLFHTACTRAKNNVFVLTPKGFTPPWPP
ncbi:MAG: ATP-dependent helicase [Candidatus Aminicenantes bacterium]|nr:ATP-dependent helicase [Candidatus Aminicenantes bacterium]